MQIVLHIGVHKTASTYVQAILEASRDRLGAEGIGYVTLEEMRSGITGGRAYLALRGGAGER